MILDNNLEVGQKLASELEIKEDSHLFKKIPQQINIWMSHSDSVKNIPTGFKPIANTATCDVAAYENIEKKLKKI